MLQPVGINVNEGVLARGGASCGSSGKQSREMKEGNDDVLEQMVTLFVNQAVKNFSVIVEN